MCSVAKAAQATADFAVNTVQTIKEDPWKFAAEVAVGIAVAAAVGALCAATAGVGCVIVAGVVAGAASAGVGYGMDVGRGKREFSAKDLATEMAIGAAVGGLTAGAGKFVPKGGRSCESDSEDCNRIPALLPVRGLASIIRASSGPGGE